MRTGGDRLREIEIALNGGYEEFETDGMGHEWAKNSGTTRWCRKCGLIAYGLAYIGGTLEYESWRHRTHTAYGSPFNDPSTPPECSLRARLAAQPEEFNLRPNHQCSLWEQKRDSKP